MIDLHVFPSPWPFNPSPFCLKAETYCRLAGIEFRSVDSLPLRAPRGKLPFLSDGPEKIPDSALIISYLKQRFGNRLDQGLDAAQHAKGHLIRRCCEESLYFVMLYERWIDPDGWKVIKPALFGAAPPLVRDAVAAMARRGVRRALNGQGYGRYAPQEVLANGAADLEALSASITPGGFAIGERPTSYDATLYAFLTNILDAPVETLLKAAAQEYPELSGYLARMHDRLDQETKATKL
ncbi:MAG: glutathione S-transferase family protein [Methylovirgula sp.]